MPMCQKTFPRRPFIDKGSKEDSIVPWKKVAGLVLYVELLIVELDMLHLFISLA
jgi:hypothetical protein